jgi:hypothetical protein
MSKKNAKGMKELKARLRAAEKFYKNDPAKLAVVKANQRRLK